MLCALAPRILSLKLFKTISEHLFIKQKTIKHKPIDKLKDAFISILAGAHGLCEANTRLRSDVALQRAFGRSDCAEQSVVQETLDACTVENTIQLSPIIIAAEQVLELDEKKRSRTVLRMDAGGGGLNWVLGRSYQLYAKGCSSVRAESWAVTVKQWFDDPNHPDRHMGWAEPTTTTDYIRPVRRLVIR